MQEARAAKLAWLFRRLVNCEIGLTIILALVFYVLYTHAIIDTSLGGTAACLSVGAVILGIPAAFLRRTATALNVERKIGAYYQSRQARLQNSWSGMGDPGNDLAGHDHPLCRDLDLFGSGSLFEYLSSAKTGAGRQWLADALLHPPATQCAVLRQQAIAELRANHALREKLAETVPTEAVPFKGEALASWLQEPFAVVPLWLWTASIVLAVLNLAAILLAIAGRLSPEIPLPTVSLVVIATVFCYRKLGLGRALKGASPMVVYELELLRRYRRALTSQIFEAECLRQNQAVLQSVSDNDLRRLLRRVNLVRWGQDPAFAYLSYLLLWAVLCTFALEGERKRIGHALARVATAVGELEGLSSLAAFSFEHPLYPFPKLLLDTGRATPTFKAVGMQHPLIQPGACVANPATIDANTRLVLVSGSNMSGKSTYLRSIGLNFVLARAGAPASCQSLEMSCFSLATSIRVQDSLQDGKSRFLAEVTRVREILDQARTTPVLFLLDELLSGTNSEERRAGIAGLVTRLLACGASGFLTTHDLALTELVFSHPDLAKNVYFVDQLSGAELAFDYQLRYGVPPHSNGLAILTAMGLV